MCVCFFSLDSNLDICAVHGCKNHAKNRNSTTNETVKFHLFPFDNKQLLNVWLESINTHARKPVEFVTKHSKICQMHFTSEDYLVSHENSSSTSTSGSSSGGGSVVAASTAVDSAVCHLLKSTAVPSQFNPDTDNDNENDDEGHDEPSAKLAEDEQDEDEDELNKTKENDTGDGIVQCAQSGSSSASASLCSSPRAQLSNGSSSAKKKGLSDVINKLHKQQSNSGTSLTDVANRTNSQLNQSEDDDEPPNPIRNDSESDPDNHKADRDEASCANNDCAEKLTTKDENEKVNANSLTSSNLKIETTTANSSQLELANLLTRANLAQYLSAFIEQGGDDVNQLCDADELEFKEICDLVGMSSKPLHVKRLKKAIDEYKATAAGAPLALASPSNQSKISGIYFCSKNNLKTD